MRLKAAQTRGHWRTMAQKCLLLMKKSLNRARKVENQSLQEIKRQPKVKIYSDCITADQQVTREYRRIYGEFWCVFALASLSSEVSSSEHQHRVSLGTPNRFDAELVRDVIH